MATISIIVPVYNVEEYLALTLRSAMCQTFTDIEIICVNDGSTDGSLSILEAAQKKDPRIKVYSKENGGLSSARNAGIKQASGKYLCFLDSDDLLEPQACEVIVGTFERTGADVVTYGANAYPSFRGYTWLNEVLSPRDVEYDGFRPSLLLEENSCPFVWRTACRTDFLKSHNLSFDEDLAFGEDQVFHFAVYPRSARTVLISDKLLKYRVTREGSLMFLRKKNVEEKIADHIAIVNKIFKDWYELGLTTKYADELLLWSADFILPELVSQKTAAKKKLYPQIKKIWTSYISDNGIKRAKQESIIAPLIRIVMDDRYSSTGHFARLSYFISKDGLSQVVKHRVYMTVFGFLHPFRKVARWLLPKSSPKKQRAIKERAWDAIEAKQRQEATKKILVEN